MAEPYRGENGAGIVKGCTKRSFCPKELHQMQQTAAASHRCLLRNRILPPCREDKCKDC